MGVLERPAFRQSRATVPGVSPSSSPHFAERQRSREIVAYYDAKTAAILERYGPGPRVHYHTGLFEEPVDPGTSILEVRRMLVAAQERMLSYAAEVWGASHTLNGEVLDVGCGLGGGALFWAQEYGARVTAVTCVASHIAWVRRFAAQAGVASLIRPFLCDAVTMPGECHFDAAVAVDSSGYLPRRAWMSRTAKLLRPGGSLFIIDCLLNCREYEAPFNRHWHTRIGTLDEYTNAALEAGLTMNSLEDVSARTRPFWTLTIALLKHSIGHRGSEANRERMIESLRMHRLVRDGLANQGLRYVLMSLRK
ncbi:MAG: SAM-dependent methyltransferase [Candidatus Binataceae bacterium]